MQLMSGCAMILLAFTVGKNCKSWGILPRPQVFMVLVYKWHNDLVNKLDHCLFIGHTMDNLPVCRKRLSKVALYHRILNLKGSSSATKLPHITAVVCRLIDQMSQDTDTSGKQETTIISV